MANYYWDTEETGFDFEKDKIITIQYQMLDWSANKKGELIILKEWELGEEEMLRQFAKIFMTENMWDFTPFMMNPIFDIKFLFTKFKKYGIIEKDFDESKYLFEKPIFDLKPALMLMNDCKFKGSGLDKFSNKVSDGRNIPEWYKNKEYNKITEYIEQETEAYLDAMQKIREHLKTLKIKEN